ncbi:hypothetical protein MesoLj113c_46400 [Mesorhizobium sp. 113-3-9]|nr:hypothetical protein MesoLj113c_46400 [Mesorhizobium sp. 113-3-9]
MIDHPETMAESRRKYRAKHKEAIDAYNGAWRLAHREHIAEYQRKRYPEKRDAILAQGRAYKLVNRDKVRRQEAAHRLVKKSINAIRHNPEDVYRVVSRAVSAALPRFMRDDVINSMLLAVLEGELLLQNVAARVKDYLGRYNQQYDTFKTLSLDAPMGGTDLRRIDLLEAPAPYEPEEDEEDPDMVMLRGGQSLWR